MLDRKDLAIAKATIDTFCIAVSNQPSLGEIWTQANKIRQELAKQYGGCNGWELHRKLYSGEVKINEVQKASKV